MGVGAIVGARAATRPEIEERLTRKLASLYDDANSIVQRITPIVESTILKMSDRRPLNEQDVVLIAYGDHLWQENVPPLRTLKQFVDQDLAGIVDAVHVLPFHPSKHDGGFSVADHEVIAPELGTWEDIDALSEGRIFMADCVLNHISASHPWFRGYCEGDVAFADFFIQQSETFDATHVIRPRATPLFTMFETANGPASIWTTFGPDQVDLNYRSPDVLIEMINVMLRYVSHGARLLRLDATHFIWKESGTTCLHLKPVHTIIQIIRDVLDLVDPALVVINETNVPHAENVTYFGDGYNEAQMVYNFAFPTLLAQAIQTGNGSHLRNWANKIEMPSTETCFFNHSACHDGVSMRGSQDLLSPEERLAMVERSIEHGGSILYRSSPDGDVPYEMCITYFDLLSPPDDEFAIDRFIVSQAIQLALAGVPAIYLSSFFGAHTWQEGISQHGGVRNANRERYNFDVLSEQLHDHSTHEGAVFQRMSQVIKARIGEPAFHPHAAQTVLDLGPRGFGLERRSLDGKRTVNAVHNLSNEHLDVHLPAGEMVDLISGATLTNGVLLAPYGLAWLRNTTSKS